MRAVLVLLAYVVIAQGVAPTSRAQTSPSSRARCASEYRRDADVTVFGFRAPREGDFVAAAAGPEWSFTCSSTDAHVVRAEQEGARRSLDVQLEPPLPPDVEITAHLIAAAERAHTQTIARGFTVDMRMRPRALSPDTIALAQRISMDGRVGVQFVVVRGLRTDHGFLRYTAMEWGEDPSRITTVIDALFHAAQQLAPVTPPAR